jgi:hypothetical protein
MWGGGGGRRGSERERERESERVKCAAVCGEPVACNIR